MQRRTSNELRCFCRRQPLLAVYGINDKNQPYIHVKIYKARRIFGEVVVTEGIAHLVCRECMRWHKILIRPGVKPKLEETSRPDGVDDTPPGHV